MNSVEEYIKFNQIMQIVARSFALISIVIISFGIMEVI